MDPLNANIDSGKPIIMGILNLTPDSFFDGGQFNSVSAALSQVEKLIADGADIIDVGGESTRPGAVAITLETELARVIPVIAAIRQRWAIPISIDTTKPQVAQQSLFHGANMINDISALEDPAMVAVIRDFQCGAILMHKQGNPGSMQQRPQYGNVIDDIYSYLERQINLAKAATSGPIWIDPGIGFGKTLAHNLSILKHLNRFTSLGCPILIGTSQKSFIGAITGDAPDSRLEGTLASNLVAFQNGASIFRVHNVAATRKALTVAHAIQEAQ